MSLRARTRKQEERRKKKRARKEAMRAQYRAWAEEGRNKKSKRHRLRLSRRNLVRSVRHANGPCGNVGCVRCSDVARLVAARRHSHASATGEIRRAA